MENRRIPVRPRTLKGGRIVFNQNFSTVNCIIRNLTEDGAKLEVEGTVTIPNRFRLVFDSGGPDRECEVRWRDDKFLGVMFVR